MDTSGPTPNLPRKLDLFDSLSIVIGVVIGAGIFLVPNLVAQELKSAASILWVWIFAGVISFFAELIYRLLWQGGFRWRGRDGDRRGAGMALLIALALIAIAWMLSIVIRFALSRKREYLADAGSVELTKNPDAMISALRKIEGRGELAGATSAVMEMCLDNPRQGFSNIFDTHPPIDARVTALVQFAGGHDPGPLALPAQNGETADPLDPTGPQSRTHETVGGPKPFLPSEPPIELGSPDAGEPGPWGPHRR